MECTRVSKFGFILSTSILIVSTFVFTLLPRAQAKGEAPTSITIGFIPGENPDWLKKNGVELAKALQEKIHIPVNIYISKDYAGLAVAMKEKKVDFAFFTAMTFVEAEHVANAKVLLKKVWDSPYYYSAIIVSKKSGVNSIAGLKGKRIGFVDEKSASGYLYPVVALRKKNIDERHYFSTTKFFGQHEGVVDALVKGEIDVAAVYADDAKGKSGAWTRFAPQFKDFKILWLSEPIPNDPFCVRQDFYDQFPKITHEIMFAMIDFRDEPEDRNLLKKLYGIDHMDLATSRQYDPVRELVKYINIKH